MPSISVVDFTCDDEHTRKAKETSEKNQQKSKQKRLSAHLALINFLKGMIGPGCFSLPLAFRAAGLWAGFILVFVVGIITCICMAKIVRCSQFLTSRNSKVQSLNYAEMADESFKQSFSFLQKRRHIARRFVNLCLSSLVLGICSIYYIFVVDHIREVLNHLFPNLEISKLTCLIIAIAPFILLSYVRSIRLMSFVSLAGNIFMVLSIVIIFSQLLPAPHLSAELSWYTDFKGVILAAGAVMYSFEGHPLILPLENKMKYPVEMRGWTGVLSTGISLVTITYAACGFFGYVTYGKEVKGSITLNMDDGCLNISMKVLLALVVYTGYLVQLYTITESLRPSLVRFAARKSMETHKITRIADYALRTGIVLVSFLLAVLVPNLEDLIPLVGVTAGMLLALVIPAALDVITFLPVLLREERLKDIIILLINNVFFFTLGIFLVVAGVTTNIKHLLD